MKVPFRLGVALALLSGCTAAPPESPFDVLIPPILDRDRIPGAVVVVGDLESIQYRRAFGTAKLDTVFDLASCTKVVGTTTAVMMLVEQGKLTLDDPLGKYISCFEGREINIRQLLLHRSRLPSYLTPKATTPEGILREISMLPSTKVEYTYS